MNTQTELILLPANFTFNNWYELKPYFEKLLAAPINSLQELEVWMLQRSELESFVSEDLGLDPEETNVDEVNSLLVKDSFTGNAIAVDFTMSRIVANVYDVVVFIGNIYQNPTVAYTVNGTTITFTSPPPLKNTIVVLHGLNSTTV
jgi:hypothetical protein